MTEKQSTLTGIENRWTFIHPDGDYPKLVAPDGCFYCFAFAFDARQLCEELNKLNEENEQLQERNDRQANSLDELYNLIEKEDWKALQQIIQDFKDCEEQLQKEWKCYE